MRPAPGFVESWYQSSSSSRLSASSSMSSSSSNCSVSSYSSPAVFLGSSAQLLGDKVEHCNDTHTCSCEWEVSALTLSRKDGTLYSLPIAVGIELLCWVPLEAVLKSLCCADAVHECVDSGSGTPSLSSSGSVSCTRGLLR